MITNPCPHCNNAFERLLCRICSGTGLVVDEHAAQRNQDIKTARYLSSAIACFVVGVALLLYAYMVSR